MVVVCRSRRACLLSSRNRAVLCRSRLVVVQKYEAYNVASLDLDLAVRILLGEFQERIATVRVGVRVGTASPFSVK